MTKRRCRITPLCVLGLATIGAIQAGCGQPGEVSASVVELARDFKPERVVTAYTPRSLSPASWRPGVEDSALRLAGTYGLAGAVAEGAWRGTMEAEKGLIEFESGAPLGGDDRLYAVEIRMAVSGGDSLSFAPLGESGPPTPAFAETKGPPLAFAIPVLAGGEMRTYRLDLDRSFGQGPSSMGQVRRLLLRPSNQVGAEVTIESVRLIFRDQYLDSLASGVGWHDLGEVWRETLLTRAGEVIRFSIELPENAWLDLSVGTPEEEPVRFEVALEPAGGDPIELSRRTVTTPGRWESEPVDLSTWGGRSVELVLRAESSAEGALAFWGHPTVRARHVGPAAPASERPQGVILFIADTLRRDHMSAHGYRRATTPQLSRLAAEGVRFDNAIAQGTWTKISVPSILTSLHPSSHGLRGVADRLPASVTTIAEIFRRAGYATLQTSSVPFTGQLTNLHQGVEVMHEAASIDTGDGTSASKTARPVTDRVLDWIEGHKDVPFLAVVHVFDPHSPFEPAAPYNEWWTEAGARERHKTDQEKVKPFIVDPSLRRFVMPTAGELALAGVDADAYVEREIGWYDGSIRGLDAEVGRLTDRLEHLGLRDRVVIAFTSDHGEEFLDHGKHWHGLNVYAESTDVPLLLWGPGFLPAGVVVSETVQLLDLLPTLTQLAGLPTPERAQGQTLIPLLGRPDGVDETVGSWQPRPAVSETHALGEDPALPRSQYVIMEGRWKLVESLGPPDGWAAKMLFDRETDPRDQDNVAGEHPEVVERLSARLAAWQRWAEERRVEPDSIEALSAGELERLRALGYL